MNPSAQARWQRTIEVFNERGESRQLKLFPSEVKPPEDDPNVARVLLKQVRLERARQLGMVFWGWSCGSVLGLDDFWEGFVGPGAGRRALAASGGSAGHQLAVYTRSELAIEERWYPRTALDDLWQIVSGSINDTRLYRCLDRLIPHKLERHLRQRYGELSATKFDVLLYNLTSSYMEGAAAKDPMMQRATRGIIVRLQASVSVNLEFQLTMTASGDRSDASRVKAFPLSYETFDGNRAEVTTVETVMRMVERKLRGAAGVGAFRFPASD